VFCKLIIEAGRVIGTEGIEEAKDGSEDDSVAH